MKQASGFSGLYRVCLGKKRIVPFAANSARRNAAMGMRVLVSKELGIQKRVAANAPMAVVLHRT